ncbi:glycosyltransferase family 4 protein [Spirosoma oryzicola]|uniref:glycosyltransferase family 4 protein n=1 Tax=Spirosoma oryzicola TaxID=2898794 RepID=UPI001E3C0807|nr:glycosyltransferase family 4 protein [Spirosoma oryzicola]UHG90659.1 glycosyltransferase family 4 protein [Spirosoma oryzicola]
MRFVIVSSCPVDWGGSEELWARAAHFLIQSGHQVHVFKTNVNPHHPRIIALRDAGCTVTDLYQLLPVLRRLRNRLVPYRWLNGQDGTLQLLKKALQVIRPHLTIVAQGNNFDGIKFADLCRHQNLPYVLIAQKAVHCLYPYDGDRPMIQRAYQSAVRCFFVSQHNVELTRWQLSLPLPNAKVVFNPVNVSFDASEVSSFPSFADGVRLACVARLDIFDKGQDILLEVLTKPKWRARQWQITFFGAGPHRQAVEELTRFLNIADRTHFAGHVPNPAVIWQTHHALILPSRSEGLPLAMVETMLCSRPSIVTNVGGVAELLTDNETGFLAATPTADAIDDALERAWQRLADWPQMGARARQYALDRVPADAIEQFGHQLLQLVNHTEPAPNLVLQ